MNAPAAKVSDHARVAPLDAVRGVALCMVLLIHCFWMKPDGTMLITLARSVIVSTWLSLHLFFVLSGFLITGILIRAKARPNYYRDFYIRRVLRILPAYYLLLAFIFFVYPWFNADLRESGLNREWPYLVMHVQNLRVAYGGPFPWHGVGHFWSLGVEEQFYLLWPVLIAALPLKRLPVVCAGIFLFSAGIRCAMVLDGVNFTTVFVGTLTNLDGLAAGAWVAAVTALSPQPAREQVRRVALAGLAGLAGLALLLLWNKGIWGKEPRIVMTAIPLMALASAALIYRIHHGLLRAPERWVLNQPVLVWLGRYSYGIYLIHAIVLSQIVGWVHSWDAPLLAGHDNRQMIVIGIVDLAITLPVARLMFAWVEAPALRLARSLTPNQPRGAEHPGIK